LTDATALPSSSGVAQSCHTFLPAGASLACEKPAASQAMKTGAQGSGVSYAWLKTGDKAAARATKVVSSFMVVKRVVWMGGVKLHYKALETGCNERAALFCRGFPQPFPICFRQGATPCVIAPSHALATMRLPFNHG
jgi:hypothetical protein